MSQQPEPRPELLTPAAVAAVFLVDPRTVTRWATAGKLTAIRTPGGHRRFRRADVMALIAPVAADVGHRSVPGLSQAPPGSPAAAAAAVIAEAAALALEAAAEVAEELAVRATAVLDDANAEAARAATDARQARVLATVHAAYADTTVNGSWERGPRCSFEGSSAAIAPPEPVIPRQRNRSEPGLDRGSTGNE